MLHSIGVHSAFWVCKDHLQPRGISAGERGAQEVSPLASHTLREQVAGHLRLRCVQGCWNKRTDTDSWRAPVGSGSLSPINGFPDAVSFMLN